LACLIDEKLRIVSFVLSCRVFQRQVENAFICWLVSRLGNQIKLAYTATNRNTPMREFLKDTAFALNDEGAFLDGIRFQDNHAPRLDLFILKEVGFD